MDLLRHLSFFVVIAEEGHFGNAAARIGITQPPLSQGLRKLERVLNVTLVERTAKGATLTESGRQLLPRARMLVADADRFLAEARALESSPDPTIRWGATTSLDDALMTACVYSLRGTGARVVTQTATTASLVEQVRDGHLDLAVVEHPALIPGLASGPVVRLPRWLIVPSDHPSATAAKPQLRMLRGLEFSTVARVGNPPGYDLLLDSLHNRGLDPGIVVSRDGRETLSHVAAGRCFGITMAAPAAVPGVAWVNLIRDALVMRVRIVWREGANPEPANQILDRVMVRASR